MQSKLLLIIPAYNEEDNIIKVVDNIIMEYPQFDYVVVNDGSNDYTRKICLEHNYNFIDYPVNLGLTSAFRGGLYYALCKKYDYVLQYDCDGQHKPEYIKELLATAIDKNADVVIGSRFLTGRKPFSGRMIGSWIIERCIWLTTGKKVKDPTSGMRLFGIRAMKLIFKNSNCGPEPDMLAHLMRNGLDVCEVPVKMEERVAGQSYLNISNSIRYMLRMCFSILVIEFLRRKEK